MTKIEIVQLIDQHHGEACCLVINTACSSAAIIDPTDALRKQIVNTINARKLEVEWILLSCAPVEIGTINLLIERYKCMLASSGNILKQTNYPEAQTERLSDQEMLMLGHIDIITRVCSDGENDSAAYFVADKAFIDSPHSVRSNPLKRIFSQLHPYSQVYIARHAHLGRAQQSLSSLGFQTSAYELSVALKLQ